jgi:cation:H+ antiporter
MSLIVAIAVFVGSVAVLIGSAKWFTNAAEKIGRRAGLSAFVVGVVIVSVGTSLPELVSSILATRAGESEIVSGNILGSSLSNILFVLGLTALLSARRIDLGAQYLYIDLNFLIGAATVVVVTFYDGVVEIGEATVGLLAYCVYVFYLLKAGESQSDADSEAIAAAHANTGSLLWPWLGLVASGIIIFLSANKTIESLSTIALQLGASKAIVSLTLLSIGTTLPECVVSVTAARQGNAGIAVGNVLGSCVFNALAIPGVATVFGPIVVPAELLQFSLPFYAAMMLFFYLLTQDKKVSSFEGALLLLLYVLFVGKLSSLI